MNADFESALAFTLKQEGFYSNNPADPGGATMMGVTQNNFWHYLHEKGLPLRSVRTITGDELRDFYLTRYWEPVTQGRTWPLNAVLFDCAVNSGPGTALWMLEQAKLTTHADSAPNRMLALALAVCDVRAQFFKDIVKRRPLSAVFLRGWLTRCADLRALCTHP